MDLYRLVIHDVDILYQSSNSLNFPHLSPVNVIEDRKLINIHILFLQDR